MGRSFLILLTLGALLTPDSVVLGDDGLVIDSRIHHLRNAEPREWSHFFDRAEATELRIEFELETPEAFSLMTWQQKSTKQIWSAFLNEKELGKLLRDHNHLEFGLRIPAGTLRAGKNVLVIKTTSETPDDILIGDVQLHRSVATLTSKQNTVSLLKNRGFRRDLPAMTTSLNLTALEADSMEPLPCRFTIIDADSGALVFIGAESSDEMAVREGVVYTLSGRASFRLAGSKANPRRYEIYCGRFRIWTRNQNDRDLR